MEDDRDHGPRMLLARNMLALNAYADAAKKLCANVEPAVKAALARRATRGGRVTLTVEGEALPGRVHALADTLRALDHVGRVRVRKVDTTRATLTVTVRGGDGVSLTHALQTTSTGLDVQKAQVGAVHAQLGG